MLYLQHDFYNRIFKIKHKLYATSGSAPPPQGKIVGAHLKHPSSAEVKKEWNCTSTALYAFMACAETPYLCSGIIFVIIQ
jgi:hypothetical protein